MTQTVDDLRNQIHLSVGKFERGESIGFTKEDLAAICEAVNYEIDTNGRLPPKAQMGRGFSGNSVS